MFLFRSLLLTPDTQLASRLTSLREHNLSWLNTWHANLSASSSDASQGYIDICELWGRQENEWSRRLHSSNQVEDGVTVLFEMCLARKDEQLGRSNAIAITGRDMGPAPEEVAGIAPVRALFSPPKDRRSNMGAGPGYPLRGCARTRGNVWLSYMKLCTIRAEQDTFADVSGNERNLSVEASASLAMTRCRIRSITAAPWLGSLDGGFASALPLTRLAMLMESTRGDLNAFCEARDRMMRSEELWVESYEVFAAENTKNAAPLSDSGKLLTQEDGNTKHKEQNVAKQQTGKKRLRGEETRTEAEDRHTLFVKNLGYSITEEELKSHILSSAEGRGTPLDGSSIAFVKLVRNATTGKSRGLAFVELISEDALAIAIAATHETELAGRKLNAEKAAAVADRPQRAPGGRGRGMHGGRGVAGRGNIAESGHSSGDAMLGRGRGKVSAQSSLLMRPRSLGHADSSSAGTTVQPKSNADFRAMFLSPSTKEQDE